MPTQHTRVVLLAGRLGPTGKLILKLLAEHRVLESPTVSIGLELHPGTVREVFQRLARDQLVLGVRSRSDPTRPTRWYLTALGARVAWALRQDPTWDPRPVDPRRSPLATEHDLALARLRLVIFRCHWREIQVQRGRQYLSNGPLLRADALFRLHLEQFALGAGTPFPQEPDTRYLARRQLGLRLGDPLPEEKAILIPDLFWPGQGADPPVIVEYEGSRAPLRTIKLKARHLALYCHEKSETQVVVVYPTAADRRALEGRWLTAFSTSTEGVQPPVLLTSMEELDQHTDVRCLREVWRLPGTRIAE